MVISAPAPSVNRENPDARRAWIYYDQTSAYYEIKKEHEEHMAEKYSKRVWDMLERLDEMKKALLADMDPSASFWLRPGATGFHLSQARRLKVKFRVLVKTEDYHLKKGSETREGQKEGKTAPGVDGQARAWKNRSKR